MSQKQTDYESLLHECKRRFRANEPGVARLAERSLRMIWHPFRQLLPQFGPVMAVPSVLVHNMEG